MVACPAKSMDCWVFCCIVDIFDWNYFGLKNEKNSIKSHELKTRVPISSAATSSRTKKGKRIFSCLNLMLRQVLELIPKNFPPCPLT
ncbi:hypothetical protein QQP08_007288 [Theobroma cacao]|nr:hypothetical protein QQP08_007288 [Theobroma cacao]